MGGTDSQLSKVESIPFKNVRRHFNTDKELGAAKKAVFEGFPACEGQGWPFKRWIDLRIGGEVEVVPDAKGVQVMRLAAANSFREKARAAANDEEKKRDAE